MRRYLGFCPGQLGDLAIMTVAARCLKAADPDSHLTFVISGDYREAAPLYLDHAHIDRVHILHCPRGGFDEVDRVWIAKQGFTHVFDPLQDHDHSRPWFRERHQTLEAAHCHGLPIPPGETGKITLNLWFKPVEGLWDHVAFSPWAAFYEGVRNPKAIPPERAQEIVNWLRGQGHKVLQVGGPTEPALDGVTKLQCDYFTSVRHVLGCRCMVMGDSGLNWVLSGYDFPVVGLYSSRYFGEEWIHQIQPINRSARYLVAPTVAEISMDDIALAVGQVIA